MTTPALFPRHRAVAAALALSLALAACGGDTDDTADDTPAQDAAGGTAPADPEDATEEAPDDATADFPVTVDAENGEVTIESRPERIISLSPSATEILFAIGAGDQVIAADQFSTYPEEAPTTDLSGWDPNVEAIVAYEPDLVLIANDSNDLVASLEALDIPVLANSAPADIEGGYDIVAAMGMATGEIDGAAGVVEEMRAGLAEAFASAPQDQQIRVYHELDDTFFSASSNSFIGSVYEEMGAVNIADEADADATGYPQLTEESVVEADPQLIVITDQVTYTAEDVANRPGWSQIEAVRDGNIVTVDADIASRWGPRLPQLVELVADAMNSVAAPVGR